MPEASTYFPAVFDLSNSPVQAVRTNSGDPKVEMDATGLWATDASGAKIFDLDTAAGSGFFEGSLTATKLILDANSHVNTSTEIQWINTISGAVIADVLALTGGTIGNAQGASVRGAQTQVWSEADAITGDIAANVGLFAVDNINNETWLNLWADGVGNTSGIQFRTPNSTIKNLYRDDGYSDFGQPDMNAVALGVDTGFSNASNWSSIFGFQMSAPSPRRYFVLAVPTVSSNTGSGNIGPVGRIRWYDANNVGIRTSNIGSRWATGIPLDAVGYTIGPTVDLWTPPSNVVFPVKVFFEMTSTTSFGGTAKANSTVLCVLGF